MSFFDLEAQEVNVPLTQAAAAEENLDDEISEYQEDEEEDEQEDEEVSIEEEKPNKKRVSSVDGGQGRNKQKRVDDEMEEVPQQKVWKVKDGEGNQHNITIVSETDDTFTLSTGKTLNKKQGATAEDVVQFFLDVGSDEVFFT